MEMEICYRIAVADVNITQEFSQVVICFKKLNIKRIQLIFTTLRSIQMVGCCFAGPCTRKIQNTKLG